ncbi:MAG TPA: hypothetical protein VHJ18_19415 [Streptosporangiaceae bacterium]|jgi:DNA-binding NarL/FixJ family response regulator|nr:hypothetical protein [Streptosporangiaceae bacterium]
MARSVLIVDDHAGFRAQARELLAVAGYDVVGEAADGASGVRRPGICRPTSCSLTYSFPT